MMTRTVRNLLAGLHLRLAQRTRGTHQLFLKMSNIDQRLQTLEEQADPVIAPPSTTIVTENR